MLDTRQARCRLRRQCHPVPGDQALSRDNGKPWVRIISCSENEIEDPDIPPHLSGCGENDQAGHKRYRDRFNAVIKPIHDDFNAFLQQRRREQPIRSASSSKPRRYMNLLLYPTAGEVQAPPPARSPSSSSISKAACARTRLTRFRPSQRTTTSRCSMCRFGIAGRRRHRSAEAPDRDDRQAAGAGAGQCRRLHGPIHGYAGQCASSTAGFRSLRSSRRSMR